MTQGELLFPEQLATTVTQIFQGQFRWGFEQPTLVGSVPAHGRGLEADDL